MLKTLVSGAAFNMLNIFIQIILGMLVFREMLLHFGENDFGNWSFIFAILAHISLFEFGLGNFISKLAPVLSASPENKAYFSTAIVSIFTIGLSFFILILIIALVLSQYPSLLSFDDDISTSSLLLLLGINFICVFQVGAMHAYLTGKFKIGRLNIIRAFINIVRAVAILVFLQLDYGVFAIALIFALTASLELFLLVITSFKVGLKNDIDLASCSLDSLKHVTNRGSRFLFLSINGYTRKNAALIVCGAVLGAIALVPLRIAGRLMEIYVEISVALNYILTPYFSSLSHGEKSKFNSNFLVSLTCSSFLSSIIFFNIIFLGDWFLDFWLGEVPPLTAEILYVLSISFFLANAQGPCTSMLISKDKNNALMTISILEILVLLSCIYPLITYFGPVGSAYAVALSLFVSRVLLQPIIVCKCLDISLTKYFMTIALPIIITGLTLYLLNISLMMFTSKVTSFSSFIFATVQATICIVAGLYFYNNRKKRR